MTRDEFNRRFAATLDDTDNFNQAALDILNELTFNAVERLHADDCGVFAIVSREMEFASRHFRVAEANASSQKDNPNES
jgi:hypothetical protein